LPETNKKKWQEKIETNKKRDEKNYLLLKEKGWRVIVIWECEINSKAKLESNLSKLEKEIKESI